jgi:AcrR family transcriptional regulator
MPKVTDEYLSEKKNIILECTEEILKDKPIYLISMRDIIKKAEFSQGVIYRYYSNLDEIYIDFINKHTTYNLLEEKIDALLCSGQNEKTILAECIIAIGEYLEELLKSVSGKTFYELMALYSYDLEKRKKVFPQLKFKQSLEYAQKKIVQFVQKNVDDGIFRFKIPMSSIITFVSCFIDGVAQNAAGNISRNNKRKSKTDISEMFRTLANAVTNFLEE